MELRTGRISVRFFSRRIGEGCVYDRYFFRRRGQSVKIVLTISHNQTYAKFI